MFARYIIAISLAMGMRVETVNGQISIVFLGQGANGELLRIAVPGKGWDALTAEGRRQLEAAFNQAQKDPMKAWVPVVSRPGAPAQVSSTEDGKVLLIARDGHPEEVSLWFDRSDALALAASLVEWANRLPEAPPRQQ